MPLPAFAALMTVLGLAFGSFANVVIWRFPRGESLSSPPSHCPKCDTPIRWYDNIPVVSWVLLGGRCRECRAGIPIRYPIVELLGGLLWLLAAMTFGVTARALFAAAFYYLLLILAFIDLDTMRLPNPLVGLTVAIGAVGCAISQVVPAFGAVPLIEFTGWLAQPVVASLAGVLASAGIALAIAVAYSSVRKTSGFGMGDVKLLAAIGVFLGPYGLLTLFLGSVLGAGVGIAIAVRNGGSMTSRYPFGPFLALSAVIVSVYGPAFIGWYLGLVGL